MKFRYRNEDEMKDSGVEWIGNIPKVWKLKRNKNVFNINKNIVGEMYDNYKILSLTLKGVIERDLSANAGKIPATFSIYQLVNKDSLLLCLFDMDVTPRIAGYVSKEGIVSSAYTNIEKNIEKACTEYFYYWFLRMDFQKILLSYSKSLRSTLTNDNFMSIQLVIPPFQEQQKIANFLEEKIAQFDTIISKKESLIKRLDEAKQSLISEVVTGKVKVVKTSTGYELVERKKEEMKHSGVEWLGDVPMKWQVKKVKHIVALRSGDSITSENIEDKGRYPVYGGNGLRGYTNRYTHDGDYVLIGRQGALCGNINYAYSQFWASEHAVVVTPLVKLDLLWLGELFRSMNLNQYSVAAAQPGLAVGMIQNLRIPYASIDEQKMMSMAINEKTKIMDVVVEGTKEQIKKLKEAKQSLISEAVTGKIEILG